MKKLVLTTVLALGTASPVLAQSMLQQQLGVSGDLSTSQLAILLNSSEKTGNESRTFFGNFDNNERFSTRSVHSPRAQAIFEQHRRESNEGSVAD